MAINPATNISIVDTAIQGWRDALAARQNMPTLFWIALAVMIGLGVLHFIVGHWWLTNLVFAIANGVALTPFALAIHRFVLLGEVRDSYDFTPTEARFQKFFLYAIGLEIVSAIPRIVGAATPIYLAWLVHLILGIIAAIIVIRTVIVFPAIAVDAPGAEWRNAMEDTKGHSWSVFLVLLCCAVPPAIVAIVVLSLFAASWVLSLIVAAIVVPVIIVLTVAAADAAISRLFAAYANLLGRPSNILVRAAV